MSKISTAWNSIKKGLGEGVTSAADFAEGYTGTGSSLYQKADDFVMGNAMGSRSGDSAWSKLSSKMGGMDSSSLDDIGRTGLESGIIGAGMGAVGGLFSDDQSMLGGAFMGAAGGAALGAGSKALKTSSVGGDMRRRSTRIGARTERLEKLQANTPSASSSLNPATRLSEDRSSGRIKMKGRERRLRDLIQQDQKGLASSAKISAEGVNPWMTGGLAAGGSLAYATLSSNRY